MLRIRRAALKDAVAPALAAALGALLAAGLAAGLPGNAARADVRLVVREDSWTLGKKPPTLATLVRTEVSGRMRRLENEVVAGASDSLRKVARHVQIDRVDRDTSYYCRPDEKAYLTVGYSGARDSNLRRAAAFRRAQALGQAPRDTIPPVHVREIGHPRVILGVPCRGYVVTLHFTYHDSLAAPGEPLGGVLADTVWMAPPGSVPDEVARFDEAFARATAADSFMVAPNAVQLAGTRGQGLVSVLTRALRRLSGFALASSYENVLYGIPKGMAGMDRRPDGGVVVQRTRRETVELSHAALPATRFEVPAGYRRLGPGLGAAGAAGAAGGAAGGGPGPP